MIWSRRWSDEVARVDGDRLVVLALLVLLAAPAGVEAVEEDLLPVDLVLLRLFGFFRGASALPPSSSLFLVVLRLDQSRNGLFSSSCLRCCCRSSSGMYSRSIA